MLLTGKNPMIRLTQTLKKIIIHFSLALLLAGLSLVWLQMPPAYAAAPPVCYPNTPFADLRLENSPLADHAEGGLLLDFDGDGKTDVFSVIPEDGQYRWRFSAGARRPWQNLGRSVVEPSGLRFGDFNGDGKTDIFSIGPNGQWRYSDGGVTAWQPLFQDPDQIPLADLRFGDFDGDGKTDIFRIGSNGRWQISPGGANDWQDLNPLDMGTLLTNLRFGDFDGDGKTDAFRRRNGKVGRWEYSPGAAGDWQDLGRASNALTSLRFGDFDGDGKTDAFRRQSDGQWQYSSDAAGEWQNLTRSNVELADLRFGDFNGDGVTDVLSQAPGGRWRASYSGVTGWRSIFATVEVNGGLLTCLTGASEIGRNSRFPAISADGSKIVFNSNADFNNQGIPPSQSEIWLYDADAQPGQELTRITNSGLNRNSLFPTISADGSKIAFESDADFNNEGDIEASQYEIWLYDLNAQSGQEFTRITTSGSDRSNFYSAISADGSKVVFVSNADFNNEGDIGVRQYEIWLHDVDGPGGNLTRLTTASGAGRENYLPAINANGSKIVFVSNGDFNNEGLPADQYEIWLYNADRPGGNLTRLTDSGSDIYSDKLAISADGRKIAFESDTDFNNEGDIEGGQFEIWLYDLNAQSGQEFTRITHSGPDRDSASAAISADGRKIAFLSDADFKGEGLPEEQYEIWLYDADAGPGQELTRLTNSGSERDSSSPAINADGSKIVFASNADFLGLGTPGGQTEIWLFEPGQAPPPPPPSSGGGSGTVYLPIVLK
jgi:Tol biopolymer transport system component